MKNYIFYIKNLFLSLPIEKKYIISIAFILIFAIIFFILGTCFSFIHFEKKYRLLLKENRKDAIKRSKAVINGQVVEQIAPFLPEFPCSPLDVKFIGKPIDFIGFSGLSENDKIENIVFIEVKTADSNLSSREKEIKDAIKNNRIKYVEYRLKDNKFFVKS